MPAIPTYRFTPNLAFPEVPAYAQHTGHRPWCSMADVTLTVSYVLSGHWFEGVLASIKREEFAKEITQACLDHGVPEERMVRWADSVLRPPEYTLSDAQIAEVVPSRLKATGFIPHPYQRAEAAWSGSRCGGVGALGMGVGKTIESICAAITAKRLGLCSDSRCYIVGPLNCHGTWTDHIEDLRAEFKDVAILSQDSLHKYQHLPTDLGGALIFDEAHSLKDPESDRTAEAHKMRLGFDWACTLTGTLMHTGCDAIMSLQDLAVPGLSRFMDVESFAQAFNCWRKVKFGRMVRHKVGLPTLESAPHLAPYLARGVRSLSNESPDVASVMTVPPQEKVLVTDWEVPAWVTELIEEENFKFKAAGEANGADLGHEYSEGVMEAANPIRWPPIMDEIPQLGAMATAVQRENRLRLIAEAARTAELLKADPTSMVLQELNTVLQTDLDEPEPLPSASALFDAARREGLYDRCMRLNGNGYDFVYAPGSDWQNPKPGPKIRWVTKWLDDHPEEPLVIAAFGVPTLEMIEAQLKEKGIDYRMIRGGVKSADRRQFQKEFNEGAFRVMLLQQKAGSVSISLVRACYSVLVDHGLSPVDYDQLIKRTARQRQTRDCTHFDLCFVKYQRERVRNMQRGIAFDDETRKELERQVGVYRLTH